MKSLYIMVLCCTCISKCNQEIQVDYFEKYESTSDLNLLWKELDYFDKLICMNDSLLKTVELCYKQKFDAINIIDPITKSMQTNLNAQNYINGLNLKTFDLIWEFSDGWEQKNHFSPRLPKRYIILKESPYLTFLMNYVQTKEGAWLENYMDKFQIMKSISPTMIDDMLENNSKIDFNNPFNRLIVIIHYLTVEYNNSFIH